MAVLGNHRKSSHFTFTGRPKKKQFGKLVIIPDSEGTKTVELMHIEMGESEKMW